MIEINDYDQNLKTSPVTSFEKTAFLNAMLQNSPIGIGLYISREIIERHGGKSRVESKENKGSRFIVTLPANAPINYL